MKCIQIGSVNEMPARYKWDTSEVQAKDQSDSSQIQMIFLNGTNNLFIEKNQLITI